MRRLCTWLSELDWHKRVMELAALATVATVGFAAYQILSDRTVRVVEARLNAIDLIVPRFSFALSDQFQRYRTVEELDNQDSVSVKLDLEAFNESGLTFSIAAFGQRCVEDYRGNPSSRVRATVAINESFPPFEGPLIHRISKGSSRLDLSISIEPNDLAESNLHVTVWFYDLTVPEGILETVSEAFSAYDDDFVLEGTVEEFFFDVLFTADTDEEAYSLLNCELGNQAEFEAWKARVKAGDISDAGVY